MQTLEQLAQNLVPYLKPWFVSLQTTPVAVGARVHRSAAQVIASGVKTALVFTATRYDTDGLWSANTPTRLTCTRAGIYCITGHVHVAVNPTGVRYVYVQINNTADIAIQGGAASPAYDTALSVSTPYQLAVGDYVELYVYQDAGGDLNVPANPNSSPEFAMHRLA